LMDEVKFHKNGTEIHMVKRVNGQAQDGKH
jgi:hypothetical protein